MLRTHLQDMTDVVIMCREKKDKEERELLKAIHVIKDAEDRVKAEKRVK